MLSVNERVHVDLSDEDLGEERPVLGATDGPFFTGPGGERFASPMSLVGSLSFPFYLAAMRRADLADDPRFRTPELRMRNLAALRQIVQTWIFTFPDMRSLDAQLDEAKIASGEVRTLKEFAETEWAREWPAVRRVSDRAGGEIRIPGRPWHFDDKAADDDEQFVACQGENNAEILTELGYSPAEISALSDAGVLVEPPRAANASEHDDTPAARPVNQPAPPDGNAARGATAAQATGHPTADHRPTDQDGAPSAPVADCPRR
jgi:hypothetical protein